MIEESPVTIRSETVEKPRLFPAVLLLVLPSILFYKLFAGYCLLPANLLKDVYPWRTGNPNDLVPWNVLQFDGITQFYPWRLFAAETWKSGYVPLWNPHQFCGTPFLANGQSAVLYPPNLIFLLMPVKFAFGWSDLLHLAFTGVTAYLFFRRAAECSRWAAVIGAACWQLSTWQISWIALPTFLDSSAWLPAAVLSVNALARRPTAARATILGIVLAMMVLAGHLQITLYCILLTAAYAIYSIIVFRVSSCDWLKSVAIAASLTVLLAAVQVLPTIELSRDSHRAGHGASSSGYNAYTGLAMPVGQLAGLFVPGYFGHPQYGNYWGATNFAENAGYVGTLGLLLGLVAVFSRRRKSSKFFFFGVAIFAILIAIGSPLNYLLYYGIPGFAQTGSPARILVLLTFSIAYLASLGADDVFDDVPGIWLGSAAYVAAAIAACGGTAIVLLKRNPGFISNLADASNDLRLFVGVLLIGGVIILAVSKKMIRSKIAGPLLFLLASSDLLLVNLGYNPMVLPGQVYPTTPAIAWLQQHAGYDRVMPINSHWSITQPPNAVLPPNGATVFGLYDLQGYDSLQTKSYKQFADKLDGGADSSPVQNGNIVFVNGVGSEEANFADAKFLYTLAPIWGLGSPVVIDGSSALYVDTAARPIGGDARVTSIAATRIDFNAIGPFDASIQDYPGWKLSDSSAQITQSETGPFMHVSASRPGTVELRYQPASFQLGLYLSLVGLLIIAAQAVATRKSINSPA